MAELLGTIGEVVRLLEQCDHPEQAAWFRRKAAAVERAGSDPPALGPELRELRGIIAGMGSFSDLSLYLDPASGISRAEARPRQRDLVERLDRAVRAPES